MNKSAHYYSERGMINCLVNWLMKGDDNCHKLLKKIDYADNSSKPEFNDILELHIYNEFSFGEFGDPDLIIKIKTDVGIYCFIIEAKIKTFKESRKLGKDIKYKDHASEIDIQLLLRKRFIECVNKLIDNHQLIREVSQVEKGYKKQDDKIVEPPTRALKKSELINWINETFVDKEIKYYYIALTKDDSEEANSIYSKFFVERECPIDIPTKIEQKEFGLIRWKDLTDLGIDNLEETCGYTFDDAHNPFKM